MEAGPEAGTRPGPRPALRPSWARRSANVLTDRLEGLAREGLLETRSYQSRPERHEYVLSEMGPIWFPPCSP